MFDRQELQVVVQIIDVAFKNGEIKDPGTATVALSARTKAIDEIQKSTNQEEKKAE
jgi:hypothetical protein